MKKQISVLTSLMTGAIIFASCSKQNDAGIQIDGNGKPGSAKQSVNSNGPGVPENSSGTCIDPNGKDTAFTSGWGIAIDPNGKDTALMSGWGIAIDPDGRN